MCVLDGPTGYWCIYSQHYCSLSPFTVSATLSFMAPQKLTEYERRRLENIKRNDEMLAALKIQSRVDDLSASSKRQRTQNKSYIVSPTKKPEDATPVVIRRSLRSRGIAPDSSTARGLKDEFNETLSKTPKSQPIPRKLIRELGPLSTRDAYSGGAEEDRKLIEKILVTSKNSQFSHSDASKGEMEENDNFGCSEVKSRDIDSIDLDSLRLEPENIARVVPGRIFVVRFFPHQDMRMVVVGNKFGNVAFWNVDSVGEDGDGIYLYQPHSGPVSGIAIQPFSMSKIFTCCYDGLLRLMDVEKETFDLAYSSDHCIYSISLRPNDMKSLYFSEGQGGLNIWDERSGKSSSSWALHESRINSIDFNVRNTNIMATSSTDGTVCIWDLRKVVADNPKALTSVSHKRAVHSAYFSPSGSLLATTSVDDTVGLLSGADYDNVSMVHHNNKTGRWISPFRGIWGWDDSYVFIGNMRRGVDVISTAEKRCVATLHSSEMSAIPCRFDVHPFKVGMLAGATSGGQVYIWTSY